uniref:Uncharacterized protein LOC105642839 n=1 Tax=Rhizophora mucronata TaxID=61149 RepID=A0A2P2JIL7_RHIMU
MKMQSKLRSDLNGEHSGHGLNPLACPPPPPPSQELVGIEISRFNGNNYQSWASKMEFFLNQLNIGYVLSDPCPSPSVSAGASPKEIAEAKAAQQKWINDNYMCHHHILNSLSDALHCQYSKKTKSAKELWETLKLVYLFEEFGTKGFQVKKYVEFQMVDEKPVLEQIQEFNSIADSIVATGTFLDENFHVSVILSKLPPSWKDFCIKLMHEEYLPFWMLMDHVRVEEESRNRGKQGEPPSSVYFHHASNLGPRMRDLKKPGLHWKRNETKMNKTIPVCSFCGKKGHNSKNCRNRKLDKEANEKHDRENSSTPAVSEAYMENSRKNI